MKSRIYTHLSLLLLPLLLLIVCAAIPAAAQKVVLSHGGALTFYDTGDMAKALDAAVKNDTIFLPESIIPGNFTVTKDITIMGCGSNSIINGFVEIAPEETGTQWNNVLFDGVLIDGDLYSATPTNGLHIRNSTINGRYQASDQMGVNHAIKNIMFQSCSFKEKVFFGYEANNIKFINCYLSDIACSSGNSFWSPGTIQFINSTIINYDGDSSKDNFNLAGTNSIFYAYGGGQQFRHSNASVFNNCLILRRFGDKPITYGSYFNCIFFDDMFLFNEDNGWSKFFCKEGLLENNCIGNDGTVMGHLGALGFSLNPSLPFIAEKDIQVDEATGVLKVQLKIGGLTTASEDEPENGGE